MSTENANQPAFPHEEKVWDGNDSWSEQKSGLTKLEYALIHSTWEPSKADIEGQAQRDRQKNPHNEPGKPALRSYAEIVRDLKIEHFKVLLY